MPIPTLYDALAARLHGHRRVVGFCFLACILLTALGLIAFRGRLVSPIPVLIALVLLLFFAAALSAGFYLVSEWFDPEGGSLHSLPKMTAKGRTGSARRWISSIMPWICAIFLDLWFLAVVAITLQALYRAIF